MVFFNVSAGPKLASIKCFDLLTVYIQSLLVSSNAKYVYKYGYFVL